MYNLQGARFESPRIQLTMSRFFYSLLILICFDVAAWGEPLFRTVFTDSRSLVIKFKLPELRFDEETSDGETYSKISFNGAQHTLEVGYPRLPTSSQLIGIPVGEVPQATIINSQFETRPTKKVLPVQSDLVRKIGDSLESRTMRVKANGVFYRQNRFYPKHIVEVVPVGLIRDQRVAQLKIHPVQYNPQLSKLRIYRELEIRIDFNQSASSVSQAPAAYYASRPFEELFQSSLFNYNQAKAWRLVRRPQAQLASTVAGGETEQRCSFTVSRTGMHRISYNRLERSGVDTSQIDLETLKLENNGRMVGVYVYDKAEDGTFDRDDSIVFYGKGLVGNKFTDTNVYWLSWNSPGSSRVSVRDVHPITRNAQVPVAFLKTQRFEKDIFHDSLVSDDVRSELADHYFWASLKRGDSKSFPIHIPGAVPHQSIHRYATLRIRFQGASLYTHAARLILNNKWLGRTQDWKRQRSILAINRFQQRQFLLHDVTNGLTVVAEADPRLSSDEVEFYVDWFELDYWHSFRAESGALEFNSNTEPASSGTVQYRVENLRTSEIDAYEVQDGSIVAKLVNGRIAGRSSPNFRITIEDAVTQPSSYVVLDNRAYLNVSRIVPGKPATLRDPANQADYIMISHKDFLDSLQPLVEFRRSQGYSVIVVDIDDVYDQFNHGVFSPFAIQHFLRYAYANWRQPAPSYVLLVGDAHYDYKRATIEYWRLANKTFRLYPIYVPTIHGWAPVSGETAMDHRFVTVSGDDTLPDMFIGRLSVQFARELDVMVKKLINYEQNPKLGVWQRTIAQVSDDEKSNSIDWIFEESRDRLIKEFIPIGYDTREIYLRRIESPERTKGLILQSLREGVVILEYAGHGGAETWADEGIFRIEDVTRLRNQHLPFIITTTCLNGQFDKPLRYGTHSLSEQFMMGRYGAIGTLSATRLTFATANAVFDEDLFTSIFNVKPATLGAITADAKIKFIGNAVSSNRHSWVPGAEQYTLFGDPATPLALPNLEVKVELEDIALHSGKQLVIKRNAVGQHGSLRIAGKGNFQKAADFSTDRLSAAVLFANNFDEDPNNDLSRRREDLDVWNGEFGNIRFDIPLGVTAGRGIVRLFASDGENTAIGGTEFWTEQPVVYEVSEKLDLDLTNTLKLHAQIVDYAGQAGIKSVDVVWNDSIKYKSRTAPMVPNTQSSVPVINGGQWWRLQTPIPLPPAERSILYQIQVTDKNNHKVFYPSKTEQRRLNVPGNANLAIAPNPPGATSIRYGRLEDSNAPALMVDLINDGGSDVPVDVEVWFAEGNPDRNADHKIDDDAKVVGSVVVDTNDWERGNTFHQKATAILTLNEPLSRGTHEIHVFIDPERPHHNQEDRTIGALHERVSGDNRGFLSFDVNEFTLQPGSELAVASLDRVFEALFPFGSLEPTTFSVGALEAPTSSQPDLYFTPIPLPASVPGAAISLGSGVSQAYNVELPSFAAQLDSLVEIRFRFESKYLEDQIGLVPSDDNGQDKAIREPAIYTWMEDTESWKHLPSKIHLQENGHLLKEGFLTPAQGSNRDPHEFGVSQIRVNPDLTPLGKWVILFRDSDSYIVLLRETNNTTISQVGRGFLDQIFRYRDFHVDIEINSMDSARNSRRFEFGDVLTFETKLDKHSRVVLAETRNSNRGNGNAEVNLTMEPKDGIRTGDWLILFRDSESFEILDNSNISNRGLGDNVLLGSITEPLFISDPGIEVLITPGDEPFTFGDKFKFSTKTVSFVSTEASELRPFALMTSLDTQSPRLQLWLDGEILQSGKVISPRPKISMILKDTNGIDMDAFRFVVSKNGGPLREITEFTITSPEQTTPITIYYAPVLSVGRYLYRLWVKDMNGNTLENDGGYREFTLIVEEPPDVEPPDVEIRLNQEILTDGMIVQDQPEIEVQLEDDYGIDSNTVQVSFARVDDELLWLPRKAYDLLFDESQPEKGTIVYSPSLANDEYQIQIFASDTSGNTHHGQVMRFQIDEAVEIRDVRNVPNPIRTSTFFTYNFLQSPEYVSIKIYSVTGKLVRTIIDASADRGYNETYWDGRDEDGVRLANGTYFYKLTVEAENRELEKVGRLAILR